MAEEETKKDNVPEFDDDIDLLDEEPRSREQQENDRRVSALIEQVKKSDNAWGVSPRAQGAVKLAMAQLATKNGMYARVPLICKADECPYAQQCQLLPYGLAPEGEYCAVELAQIDLRAMGYSQDINFEESSFTDKMLISELITLDIMLERCKALMAKEGTPVVDIAIGVDQEGNEIDQPAVSKAWEAYEKISNKRDKVYKTLMLTRESQKNSDENSDAKSLTDSLREAIEAMDVNISQE